MAKCPICGSDGDDLVFKFYCTNPACKNYKPGEEEDVFSEERKAILRSMWKMWGRGESQNEFSRNFFSEGGRIEFPPGRIGAGFAKVIKPKWLKDRIARGM